jgi:hypothetical protein
VRKTRVIELETGTTLCKFEREPSAVSGKWQVDLRRGDGGGYIFVGKYERYEWARQGNLRTEVTWVLVHSTYSHSKTQAAARRRGGTMGSSDRSSMDDSNVQRRLGAKIKISGKEPPVIVITPRNLEKTQEMETVNREEVLNALIQALWIVWREGGVVDETVTGSGKGTGGNRRKPGCMDIFLCRN